MDSTSYALLSTLEQELIIYEAQNWGDALTRYIEEEGLEWDSLLGCLDQEPSTHWTIDLYDPEGEDETIILMELEELRVQATHTLPVE